MSASSSPDDIWAAIVATVVDLEMRAREPNGAVVKAQSQVLLGYKIVEGEFGYRTFKELVIAAESAGLIRVTQGKADSDFTLQSIDKEFRVLAEVVGHLIARGARPFGGVAKPLLKDALGGTFSEIALGYKNFKEFALAAEAAGYVEVRAESADTDFLLAMTPGAIQLRPNPALTAAFRELRLAILETPARPVPGGAARKALVQRDEAFKESDHGFHTFKRFALAAEAAGEVTILSDDSKPDFLIDALSILDVTVEATSLEVAFEDLRRVAIESHQSGASPFASAIKSRLMEANPGFAEQNYKYARFGEFLADAEQAGYVSLRGRTGHGRTVIDVYPPDTEGLSFSDIRFGYVSAGAESVRDPALLLEGFYDFQGVVEKLLSKSEYLVLGYKGSGKSAIGEHLAKRAEKDPLLFVDFIDLKDFPYGTLSELAADDSSQQLLRLSWRWLLLLRVFQSMLSDQGAEREDDVEATRLARELEKQGLLPSKSFSEMSIRSVNLAVKGGLPNLFEGSVSGEFITRQSQLTDAIGRLEAITARYRTDSKHIHVIDGLDELLTPDARTYSSLSALLGEVESLNDSFFRSGGAAKVILLCRSDLYERLSSPNKNKLRQNFSVNLRWSPEWDESDGAELGGLIRQRARLSGYQGDDPVRDFLPFTASVGEERADVWSFLIAHTRQTPRDLIALLTKIQGHVSRAAVTSLEIQRGLNDYSSEYFVPELKDELEGYIPPEQIDQVFGLLSALKKRIFVFSEFAALADARGMDLGVIEALEILFECSALGIDRSRHEGPDHEFKYMNSNLALNPALPLIVHRGAWWALSLRTSPSDSKGARSGAKTPSGDPAPPRRRRRRRINGTGTNNSER